MTAVSTITETVARHQQSGAGRLRGVLVSFVIPAHNEERLIGELLRSIRRLDIPASISALEIIVADAESTDATRSIAEAAGCRVVTAPRGAA